MNQSIKLLCLAATIGVITATAFTCGVGLFTGTGTWCGLHLYWVFGIPIAIFFALVFGLPTHFVFTKFNLRQSWQFILCGVIFALPFWYGLAQPFSSSRWLHAGIFDSLNYLGSGAAGGFTYWWLTIAKQKRKLP